MATAQPPPPPAAAAGGVALGARPASPAGGLPPSTPHYPADTLPLTAAHPAGKGGKNRRRGKNDSDDKRELIFKEDGQGEPLLSLLHLTYVGCGVPGASHIHAG